MDAPLLAAANTPTVVAAIGDIHIDDSPNGRLAETERVLLDAADDMAERGVQAVVLTGDLFERTRSTAVERNVAVRIVRRLADRFCVLILRGNHDGLGELDFLRHLRAKHPIIVETGYAVHVVAGVAIACAAWPCKATLLAELGGTSQKANEQMLRAAFRAQMERLGEELAKHDGPRMLVAHAMVRGSATGVGQPLVGTDLEVTLDDLALARAPITVLGHVHRAQAWRGTGQSLNDWKGHDFECEGLDGAVVYTGSPRPTDFGDLDPKSYLLVHFGDTDHGDVRPVGWERIPTTATPLHVAQAHWDGTTLSLDDDLTEHAGAEVQLRYSFQARESGRVAPQAVALRSAIERAGAKKVHLAPKKIATVEARAPQVSQSRTVRDKIVARWALHGPPPHHDRVLGRLDDLALATSVPVPRPAWIRYSGIGLRGIRPFVDTIEINLDDLSGKLVAIHGEPGAGKSTLLEAFATVLPERALRTHGKLKDAVTDPTDAHVSVRFDCAAGEGLTTRQTFAAKKKNGSVVAESGDVLLLTADGQPLKDVEGKDALPSSGPAEYDAWATKHLPHRANYFAHTFLAQDRRDWLYLDDSPRKGVLLRVAGVEYLEGLAKVAGERERDARKTLATLQGKCDELRRALGLPELYGDPKTPRTGTVLCATGEERRTLADTAVTDAERDVAHAEQIVADARAVAEFEQTRDRLRAEAQAAADKLRTLDEHADEHHAALASRDAVEQAERDLTAIEAEIEQAERTVDERIVRVAALDVALTEAIARAHAIAKERTGENERRSAERAAIERRLRAIGRERAQTEEAMAPHLRLMEREATIRAHATDLDRLVLQHAEEKQAVDTARAALRETVAPMPAIRDAWRRLTRDADATLAVASQRWSWPEQVRRYLAANASCQALLADLNARRAHAAAQLDECTRVHEIRATALRGVVDYVAEGDDPEIALHTAQEAAAADDERITKADPVAVASLKVLVSDLDRQITQVHRDDAAARLPEGVPATVEAAEQVYAEAKQAYDQAVQERDLATLALLLGGIAETVGVGLLDQAERSYEQTAKTIDLTRPIAAEVPALEAAEQRLGDLRATLGKLDAERGELEAKLAAIPADRERSPEELVAAAQKGALTTEIEEARASRVAAAHARGVLFDRRLALAKIAEGRAKLTAADAGLAEIARQRTPIEADQVRVSAALFDLEEHDVVLSFEGQARRTAGTLSLTDATADLAAARAVHTTAQERSAVVAQNLTQLAERERERESALADAEDWGHLASVLGRNGIQADEVDAVGPRVAEVATTLLHECYGPGWTVTEIDTVGSCDAMIAVADEQGDPRSDRTFSPGQRAILAGVFAMAIAATEAQNAGAAGTTLLFDEAGGPLSPTMHLAWVRMIRKIVEIVGADKALYISHDEGAVAQADVRIRVAGGRVEVEQ
jgi:exonuclease SbcD